MKIIDWLITAGYGAVIITAAAYLSSLAATYFCPVVCQACKRRTLVYWTGKGYRCTNCSKEESK